MEDNVNPCELEQDNVLKVIEQAADELDEEELSSTHWHEKTVETTSVRAILKRQKEGKIKLPLCQRLYVWNETMRRSLFESVERNYPCGAIILAESAENGIQYLTDGLQRITSLMYLSIDFDQWGLTKEQKKMVLDYQITIITAKGLTDEEIKDLFNRSNSGIALASVVKERSKLPNNLNNLIMSIANHDFFRTLNTEDHIKTTPTFTKSGHHELIAMNTLIAASGLEQETNKAKDLCKTIREYETDVTDNYDKAVKLIERIADIYNSLDLTVAKRALNANFVGTLVYVITGNDYSSEQIVGLINYIFEKTRALPAYAATTRAGAGDAGKCAARCKLLKDLLNNPPVIVFDEDDYKTWCKDQTGKAITDQTGDYMVDFADVDEHSRKGLYMAVREGKRDQYNRIVQNVYERLDSSESA